MIANLDTTDKPFFQSHLQQTVEAGLLIALALAFSQFRLLELPNGGSISLGGVPLLVLAARQRAVRGIEAGFLAGILSALRRPVIVNPVQFLLDYPIAHAALGTAGIFKWNNPIKAAVATTLACGLRLLCHTFAGIFFFTNTQASLSSLLYMSAAYNAAHMLPEAILNIVISMWLAAFHPQLVAPYSAKTKKIAPIGLFFF